MPLRGFFTIATFHLRQRLRQLSTWVYFAVFFGLSFLFFIAAAGAFASVNVGFGTGGKVMVNSPHTLAALITAVAFFVLPVTAALAGQAIHQDYEHRTYAHIFTAPVSKAGYLGGRFLAALLVLVIIHASIGLGCAVGSVMPFVDRQLIGDSRAMAYLGPYLNVVLPNVLIMTPLFFGLGALSRKMRTVYVTAIVLLIGNFVASALSAEIDNKQLAALLDPTGGFAFERLTEYWSVAEKNGRLVPLAGVLLANRLLWLAVAAVMLGYTFVRFKMAEPLERAGAGKAQASRAVEPASAPARSPQAATGRPAASGPAAHHLLPRLTFLAFRETIKSVHFVVLLVGGMLFVIVMGSLAGTFLGTATYPVTRQMIELGHGSFRLFALAIVIVYAGDLVWRERDARFDQIIDATPVPSWLLYTSKLGALMLVGLVLQLVVIVCGIGIQIFKGYFNFQLGLYVFDLLGLRMLAYFPIAVLALFLQVVLPSKHLGQFAMVLYFIADLALPLAGFEHRLYRYGASPPYVYSDMNGYGHMLQAWGWFNLYWSLGALLLAGLTALLWPRGQTTGLRQRLRLARGRLRGGTRVAFGATALAFAATGAFIFYNTNVLNEYRTSSDGDRRLVDYERRYRRHLNEPQPRVTDVRVHFDIRPETRVLRVNGRFRLENKTTTPIGVVYVNLIDPDVKIHRLGIGAQAGPTTRDDHLGFHTFTLPGPLPPGGTVPLDFDLEYAPSGFKNGGARAVVVANGTFVNSGVLPALGYLEDAELSDDDDRRKRKLPPRPRMADLNDQRARQRNYISPDADWITFAATACTSPDQVAFVPGYLERTYSEGGRRCFAFAARSKILHFFSVLSARYAVRRDRYGDVPLEIHHHPGHDYNVQRMMEGMKDSLAYFNQNFSPYQHQQLRILEFPLYNMFAQSFPNTVPYSESIGFIARVKPGNPKDIDYPYYVTAHEVAHQWWAHQVIGADVQGSTLLSESLSQYSALMVMKARYGALHMKRFLRHELDSYLRGRSLERKRELPLVRVEDQGYIHYNKGSLAFYALADAIGEAEVNRALKALLAKHAFRGPPYPTSLDLMTELRAVTPPEQHYLLTDLLETITLFENRAVSARARRTEDGQFEVKIQVTTKKVRADELGTETEIPLDEPLDVGVMAEDGRPLLVEKRPLRTGPQTVVLRVKERPGRAGIDPLNKLVDRQPDDNLTRVDVEDTPAAPSAARR
jgi:ABC-2 type transport system permease protein